jgi:hypothetical protein
MSGPARSSADRRLRSVRPAATLLITLATTGGATTALAQSSNQAPVAATDPAGSASSTSEDAWRAVKFGATLEVFYQYNWNHPPDRTVLWVFGNKTGAW